MNSAILKRHIIAIHKLGFEFCSEIPLKIGKKNSRILILNPRKMCLNIIAYCSFAILTIDVAIVKQPTLYVYLYRISYDTTVFFFSNTIINI